MAQRPPQPRRSAKAALAVPAAAPASATQDPAGEVAASAPQVRRVRLSRAPRSAPKAKSGAAARRGSRGCSSRGAGGSRGTAADGPRRIADFSDDDDDGQDARGVGGRRGGRVRFGHADVTEYDPTAADLGAEGAAGAVAEYGDAESGDSDGTDGARLPAVAVDSCGELYNLPMPLKVAYEDVGTPTHLSWAALCVPLVFISFYYCFNCCFFLFVQLRTCGRDDVCRAQHHAAVLRCVVESGCSTRGCMARTRLGSIAATT